MYIATMPDLLSYNDLGSRGLTRHGLAWGVGQARMPDLKV